MDHSLLQRRIGQSLLIGSFAVYVLTGVPWLDPIYSAPLVAGPLGVDGPGGPGYPLWQATVAILGWISPAAALIRVLHVCNSALAALALWLLYWAWQQAPAASSQASRRRSAFWGRRTRALSGLVSALALGVSVPFWFAATRIYPATLALALFLASTVFFLRLLRDPDNRNLFSFAGLYGLGLLESPLFVWGLPLCAFVIIKRARLSRSSLSRLLVAGGGTWLTGLILVATARTFLLARSGMVVAPSTVFVSAITTPFQAAVAYEVPVWFVALLTSVLPLLILIKHCSLKTLPRPLHGHYVAIQFAATALTLLLLFNAPPSLWPVLGPAPLNLLVSLLTAVAAGYLMASWKLSIESYCMLHYRKKLRPRLNAIRMSVMVVSLGSAALLNGVLIWGHRTPATRFFVDEVISGLAGREWIVSDGVFDDALRIRALERRQPIHVINLQRPAQPQELTALDHAWSGYADLQTSQTEWHWLLHQWLASDSQIEEKMVVLTWSALWEAHGFYARPESVFYGGSSTGAHEKDFAEVSQEMLLQSVIRGPMPRSERPEERWLRRHRARLWNDWGVAKLKMDEAAASQVAFEQARRLDSDNVSAWLNLWAVAQLLDSSAEASLLSGLRGHVRTLSGETMSRSEWAALFGNLYKPVNLHSENADERALLDEIRLIHGHEESSAQQAADRALATHMRIAQEARISPISLRTMRVARHGGAQPASSSRMTAPSRHLHLDNNPLQLP